MENLVDMLPQPDPPKETTLTVPTAAKCKDFMLV